MGKNAVNQSDSHSSNAEAARDRGEADDAKLTAEAGHVGRIVDIYIYASERLQEEKLKGEMNDED
jgi:hypothetical protein